MGSSNNEDTESSANSTHVSNVETEYLDINSRNAWAILYQHIRQESSNYVYTCNESKKPQNTLFNRYRDVSPYDHTRVILRKGPTDYINANILKMESAKRQYILTQGPLKNTAGHFWLMAWEQKSKAVIMLNKVIEKNQVKCHQYWPLEGTMEFPDIGLSVEFLNKRHSTDYITSTLRINNEDNQESREIIHFHYTAWPDFGVPQSPVAFLRFLADCRKWGALDENVGPPIVHCSAGIGRTGTFCLVDTCLVLIEENGLNSVNVKEILLEMRKSRMGLIQTPDQLQFSYAAIIQGSKNLPLTEMANGVIENENGNDIIEIEDEEPPPLPPPRGDSLVRREMNNDGGKDPLGKPLPLEPSIDADSKTLNCNSTNIRSPDQNSDLRQRRKEKKEKLETQVQGIKRKQKETEEWQNLKRPKQGDCEE